MYDYNAACELMHEFVKNDNLRKHMYCVSEVMSQYAKKYGEDEEKWAVTGLLHDFDWEIHPNADEHPVKGSEILREKNVPEDIIRAILSHADYTGIERISQMEKVLYACDELCGFIVACALVQPSRKIADVRVESVIKKLKKKEFARNVNRNDIFKSAELLGVPLSEHIEFVLQSLNSISDKLGL
jgi:putative nucleotidyltransferase with HDIG domain